MILVVGIALFAVVLGAFLWRVSRGEVVDDTAIEDYQDQFVDHENHMDNAMTPPLPWIGTGH